MSDQRAEVESTGETVGEARWAALHELERRYPSLDRDAVEFVVVSEGERGLLGVGLPAGAGAGLRHGRSGRAGGSGRARAVIAAR